MTLGREVQAPDCGSGEEIPNMGSNPIVPPETGSRGMVYLACIGGRSMSVRVRSSRPGIDEYGKAGTLVIEQFVVHTPCEVQTGS